MNKLLSIVQQYILLSAMGAVQEKPKEALKKKENEIVAKNEVPEAIHVTAKLQSSSAGQRANRT